MPFFDRYDLICILGPTASGKTGFATELAAKMSGEILSADSRQVYRGMDIGTGKDLNEYCYSVKSSDVIRDIARSEQGWNINLVSPAPQHIKIPYHLIDIADAGTKYDIFRYQRDFREAFDEITTRGRIPILCGGSGLYIEAATRGYSLLEVPSNPRLREELEKEDMESLIARLASLKHLHNHTDYDTKKRLIRALEIAIYQQDHKTDTSYMPPVRTYYIGISVDREQRNRLIDARLQQRLNEGMIDEVKRLLEKGIPEEDLIYYGLEYKFITLYLIGELSYEQMFEKLSIAIHQFAKRQMTWFRGMERKGIEINWVGRESVDSVIDMILEKE